MAENKIITIGRQFGSNGRQIGELVAKKLGVTCYDKQLIKKAAKESGLWEDLLDEMDEKPTNSFLYSVVMDPYAFAYSFDSSGYGMNINQKAFMATYNTIQNIAKNESCVIIGRCSNYVLREFNNVYNFFLYAPLEERIKIVMERFNLDEKKAKDQIVKEDKARASYFNYYTSMKWGNIESYDCCLNTTLMDAESLADLIIEITKK